MFFSILSVWLTWSTLKGLLPEIIFNHHIYCKLQKKIKIFLLSQEVAELRKDIIHLAYREITQSQFYAS